MQYVELLRARRVLSWYGGILLVITALCLALAYKEGPPEIHVGNGGTAIPFGALLAGGAIAAMFLAAFVAVGLDAEYKTAAITWTRPVTRTAIALRYVAVDLGTLLVAWAFTVLLGLLVIAALGLTKYVTLGDLHPESALRTLGSAVMWYGLVVLVTALLPGRGNAVAGGSWAYALIVPSLTAIPFPPLLHKLTVALVYIDPLVYSGFSSSGPKALLPESHELTAAIAWGIGIAAIAIGTRLWSTREVPA